MEPFVGVQKKKKKRMEPFVEVGLALLELESRLLWA